MSEEQNKESLRADIVVCEIMTAIDHITKLPRSRENSLVITKLEEALMWFENGRMAK